MVEKRPFRTASRISDQASTWFARLQADDVSADDRRRFDCWLNADPRHRQAYRRVEDLWTVLRAPAANVHARLAAEASVMALPSRPCLQMAWPCLALLLAVVSVRLPAFYQNAVSDYRTALGERLSVTLDDGSRLLLNTDTALAVHYSNAERRIDLLRGEAYFEVAPNKKRPFIVAGGKVEARAVGTAFDVRKQAGAVQVTVSEGVVAVSSGMASVSVSARRQIGYRDGRFEALSAGDVDTLLAWRRGQVVFYQQPLAEVVAEVNRYRAGHIAVVSRTLAERRISGIFNADDPDGVVDALTAILHARAVRIPGGVVVLY